MSDLRAFCAPIVVGESELSAEESHHLGTVRRTRPGAVIELFDGAGHVAKATLERFERRAAVVSVGSIEQRTYDLTHRLTLAFAPVKQHRQSFLIEKCTELGVHALWPMVTAYGVAKPTAGAIEKWHRRAIEAAKQSGRAWVPVFEQPQAFDAVVDRANQFDVAVLCDTWGAAPPAPAPESERPSLLTLFASSRDDAETLVLVGPEGGWSDEERGLAGRRGLSPASLGPTTLRAETAAVAVCAACAASCARLRESQS